MGCHVTRITKESFDLKERSFPTVNSTLKVDKNVNKATIFPLYNHILFLIQETLSQVNSGVVLIKWFFTSIAIPDLTNIGLF